MNPLLALILAAGLAALPAAAAFDDTGWTLSHHETFDTPYAAADGQVFGEAGWLVWQLINGAAATVEGGVAHLQTPDFAMAALIHSVDSLPAEYRLRTRIGHINYDLANYEPEDFSDPDFNTHGGYTENGVYFLTLTDDVCVGSECAEYWWHWHRKMVIDVDNHLDYGSDTETFHPIYLVYMGLEDNGGSQGHVLRTWDGTAWDTSDWNWNVAWTYEYATWYTAEVDKRDGQLVLRLYDGQDALLVETDPVPLELINAMDDPLEYLYLGEPHTDDYEGDVLVDDITLLLPAGAAGASPPPSPVSVRAVPNPFNPATALRWSQPQPGPVTLRLFDGRGRLVVTLLDGEAPAGPQETLWRGRDAAGRAVPSGVYFAELKTSGGAVRIQLTLVR